MSSFLNNLNWRYATKKFDANAEISSEQKAKILESIKQAPTSFGLQPFKVYVVESDELKTKIEKVGWNQPQYSSCQTLLAFCTDSRVDERITEYLNIATSGSAEALEKLKGYEGMMRGFFKDKTQEWLHNWASKQAYIALGFAMAACAELQVDSCPMEGFSPKDVDQILGLKEYEKTAVILTLGHRHPEEQQRPKTRFSDSTLFHTL